MKKFLIFVVVIAAALVLMVKVGGNTGSGGSPEILSVAEAAFSVRNSGSRDATGFLVGCFSDGSAKLTFDGKGEVVHTDARWVQTRGTYALTQTADGAAIVRMEFDDGPALYTFCLLSGEEGFSLTDTGNNTVNYKPVL